MTGLLTDSDIRDVDLDSANLEAESQVIEVSAHQGPVEARGEMIHFPAMRYVS